MQNNLNKFFFIILINICILIVFLTLLELFLGNWIFKNKINQLNIPKNITTAYKLNKLYDFKDDKIYYSRDKWGFRGKYDDLSNIDILTIGGSTTDQRYISDGYTFQDVIEREFSKENKKISIVNAGIDGQSTYGHIKNFDLWFNYIPDLNVNFYLFYIGINDFYIEENAYFDDLYGDGKNIDFIQKVKNKIKKNSVIYYLYRNIEGILLSYELGIAHNAGHSNLDPKTNLRVKFSKSDFTNKKVFKNYNFVNNRVKDYEKRVEILISKVKKLKSKAIFVTQSSRRFWYEKNNQIYGQKNISHQNLNYTGVDYYHMSRKFNNKLREICLRNNIIFIDLDEELDFDIEDDFYDQSHHNDKGAEKIGLFLFSHLKKLF